MVACIGSPDRNGGAWPSGDPLPTPPEPSCNPLLHARRPLLFPHWLQDSVCGFHTKEQWTDSGALHASQPSKDLQTFQTACLPPAWHAEWVLAYHGKTEWNPSVPRNLREPKGCSALIARDTWGIHQCLALNSSCGASFRQAKVSFWCVIWHLVVNVVVKSVQSTWWTYGSQSHEAETVLPAIEKALQVSPAALC